MYLFCFVLSLQTGQRTYRGQFLLTSMQVTGVESHAFNIHFLSNIFSISYMFLNLPCCNCFYCWIWSLPSPEKFLLHSLQSWPTLYFKLCPWVLAHLAQPQGRFTILLLISFWILYTSVKSPYHYLSLKKTDLTSAVSPINKITELRNHIWKKTRKTRMGIFIIVVDDQAVREKLTDHVYFPQY